MNDQPDLHDELRSTLTESAGALDLELAPADELARRGARRRRRKRTLLGGGAATALIAVAAIGIAGTRGDDSTVSTSDDTTATTDAGLLPPVDEAAGDTATDASDAPSRPPITTPATLPALADTAEPALSSTLVDGPSESVVAPWGDGFIRVTRTFSPQPLPDALPEDLAALFPQEVLDLFPDGLPPTIDEATTILSEAGLLDVVTELMAEHPELGEAIYAANPVAPDLRVDVASDGTDWTPVELAELPDHAATMVSFRVHAGRLLIWSVDQAPGDETEITVSTTSDLSTWSTTSATFDNEVPTSAAFGSQIWLQQVAPLGDGWVALVTHDTWVDYESLLPDEVQRELESSDGWGTGVDDDGVEIQIGDREPITFTWDELGLDGVPDLDHSADLEFLVADGAGDTSTTPVPSNSWGELLTWNDQVVLVGESLLVSSDGANWNEFAELPRNSWASGAAPVGDRLLVTGGDMSGAPLGWLVDGDGAVTPIELPDLPQQYSLWGARDSAAWVVEMFEPFDETVVDAEPVTVTFDHDGYTITLDEEPTGGSILVVETATGDTIAERRYSFDDPEIDELYQVDDATGDAWLVITDENTGDEIVRVPGEVLTAAYDDAHDADAPAYEVSNEAAIAEEWNPDYWVIATTNGVDWYTADIADPGPSGPWFDQSAAINGTTLVHQSAEGWHRVDLGS